MTNKIISSEAYWRLGSIAEDEDGGSTQKCLTQFENQAMEWKVPKECLTSCVSGSNTNITQWVRFTDRDKKLSFWKCYMKRTASTTGTVNGDNETYLGIFVESDNDFFKNESLSSCSIYGELGITVIHPKCQNHNIAKDWKLQPRDLSSASAMVCGVREVIHKTQLDEFIHHDNQLHVILDFNLALVRQEGPEKAAAEIASRNKYGIDLANMDSSFKDVLIKTSDNRTLAANQFFLSVKSKYFQEHLVSREKEASAENNKLELVVDKPGKIMQLVLDHICLENWIEKYLATPELNEIAGELAAAADDFKLPILKKFLNIVYLKEN